MLAVKMIEWNMNWTGPSSRKLSLSGASVNSVPGRTSSNVTRSQQNISAGREGQLLISFKTHHIALSY